MIKVTIDIWPKYVQIISDSDFAEDDYAYDSSHLKISIDVSLLLFGPFSGESF